MSVMSVRNKSLESENSEMALNSMMCLKKCCFFEPYYSEFCNEISYQEISGKLYTPICSWSKSFGPSVTLLEKISYDGLEIHHTDAGLFGYMIDNLMKTQLGPLTGMYSSTKNQARDMWLNKLKYQYRIFPKNGIRFSELVSAIRVFPSTSDNFKGQTKSVQKFFSYFIANMKSEFIDYFRYYGQRELWNLIHKNNDFMGKQLTPSSIQESIPANNIRYNYLRLIDFEFRVPRFSKLPVPLKLKDRCDGLIIYDDKDDAYSLIDTNRRINTFHMCFSSGLESFNINSTTPQVPLQDQVVFDIRQFIDTFHFSDISFLHTAPITPLTVAAVMTLSEFCHTLYQRIERRLKQYTASLNYIFDDTTLETLKTALKTGKNYLAIYDVIAERLYKTTAYTHIPDYIYVIKKGINLCNRVADMAVPFHQDTSNIGYLYFDKNKGVCTDCKTSKIDGGNDNTIMKCRRETGDCGCIPITSGSYGSMITFISLRSNKNILLHNMGLLQKDWVIENIGDLLFIRNKDSLIHNFYVCEIETEKINVHIPLYNEQNDTVVANQSSDNYVTQQELHDGRTHDPSENILSLVSRAMDFNATFCPKLPVVISTNTHITYSPYTTGNIVPYYRLQCSTSNGSVCMTAIQIPKDDIDPDSYFNLVTSKLADLRRIHRLNCNVKKICKPCRFDPLVFNSQERRNNNHYYAVCDLRETDDYERPLECACPVYEGVFYAMKYALLYSSFTKQNLITKDLIRVLPTLDSRFLYNLILELGQKHKWHAYIKNKSSNIFYRPFADRHSGVVIACNIVQKSKFIRDTQCGYKTMRYTMYPTHTTTCTSSLCGRVPVAIGTATQLNLLFQGTQKVAMNSSEIIMSDDKCYIISGCPSRTVWNEVFIEECI